MSIQQQLPARRCDENGAALTGVIIAKLVGQCNKGEQAAVCARSLTVNAPPRSPAGTQAGSIGHLRMQGGAGIPSRCLALQTVSSICRIVFFCT